MPADWKKLKSHSNFTYSQLPRLHRSAFGWCTSFCFESKDITQDLCWKSLRVGPVHHLRLIRARLKGDQKKTGQLNSCGRDALFWGGESNALLWTKTKPLDQLHQLWKKNESLLEKPSPKQNPGSSIPSPSPSPCKRRAGNSGSIQAWRRVTSVVMKAVCGVLWMKSSQGVGGEIRELVILSFGTHQQKWDAKRNFWDSFFTIFSKKSTIAKEVWWLSRICDGKHFPLNVFLKGWKAHAKINSKTFKYCQAKASSLENKSHPNCRTKDNLTPPKWICQIPSKSFGNDWNLAEMASYLLATVHPTNVLHIFCLEKSGAWTWIEERPDSDTKAVNPA